MVSEGALTRFPKVPELTERLGDFFVASFVRPAVLEPIAAWHDRAGEGGGPEGLEGPEGPAPGCGDRAVGRAA